MTIIRLVMGTLLAIAGVLAGAFVLQGTAREAVGGAIAAQEEAHLAQLISAEATGFNRGQQACAAAAADARLRAIEQALERTNTALRDLDTDTARRAVIHTRLQEEIDRATREIAAAPTGHDAESGGQSCPERPVLRALADSLREPDGTVPGAAPGPNP